MPHLRGQHADCPVQRGSSLSVRAVRSVCSQDVARRSPQCSLHGCLSRFSLRPLGVAGWHEQADPGGSFTGQPGGGDRGRTGRLWHEGAAHSLSPLHTARPSQLALLTRSCQGLPASSPPAADRAPVHSLMCSRPQQDRAQGLRLSWVPVLISCWHVCAGHEAGLDSEGGRLDAACPFSGPHGCSLGCGPARAH